MAKKPAKREVSWHIDADQNPPVVFTAVDPTTEQPIDPTVVAPLEPVLTYTPAPSDPLYRVQYELPMTVLFALLNPDHPQADTIGAAYYGLLSIDGLTPIGEKVLSGIDQTALWHKMR